MNDSLGKVKAGLEIRDLDPRATFLPSLILVHTFSSRAQLQKWAISVEVWWNNQGKSYAWQCNLHKDQKYFLVNSYKCPCLFQVLDQVKRGTIRACLKCHHLMCLNWCKIDPHQLKCINLCKIYLPTRIWNPFEFGFIWIDNVVLITGAGLSLPTLQNTAET